MKALIQRVKRASVTVGGRETGKIDGGILVFLGVAPEDTGADADKLADKIVNMRIFEDGDGKINLSLTDLGLGILAVPQFTLMADIKKGTRPGFSGAAKPEYANELFEYFVSSLRKKTDKVACGVFGADMQVELLNDGPFTLMLDSGLWVKHNQA